MLRATFTSILALLLTIASAAAEETPGEEKIIAALLSGVEIPNVRWRTFETSDLNVYYCIAEAPRTGAAGLELGRKPFALRAKKTDIAVEGSLGRFRVKWLRRTISDGSRQAETTFRCGPEQWARVIVEASDEIGLLQYISEFGRLAVFAPPAEEKSYAGPGLVDPKLRSSVSAEAPRPVADATASAGR